MYYKYGNFTQNQIAMTKERIRKQIFFLLLIVDPKTSVEYKGVDVVQAFENILDMIGGMNDLLNYPPEIVTVQSLLNSALHFYQSDDFEFKKYRKLVLDAGNETLKIKEV